MIDDFFGGNIIDLISNFAYGWIVSFVFPFCPLVLGHAVPSIPELALAADVKWPKSGLTYVVSVTLLVAGSIALLFGY